MQKNLLGTTRLEASEKHFEAIGASLNYYRGNNEQKEFKLRHTFIMIPVKVFVTLMLMFNIGYSQPKVVTVLEENNILNIKKLAESYLRQLDVYGNIHITIRISNDVPNPFEATTYLVPSLMPDIYKSFNVLVKRNLGKEKEMLVLAHEMIHIKQYVKSELIVDENNILWKGKRFYYALDENRNTPWENEAYKEDGILVKEVALNKKEIKPQFFKNNDDKALVCQTSFVRQLRLNCH